MIVTRYKDEDTIYIRLSEKPIAKGRSFGDQIHLDYAPDETTVVGVQILYVSDGIDLDHLPAKVKKLILPELENMRDVRILHPA